MKKIITLALILTFATITFGQTSAENLWIGKYHHENDIGKEYFMLEIFRDGETIKAKYKETITAQTTGKFLMNVVIKANTASFVFAECLTLSKDEADNNGINSCDDYESGDLILKIRRITKGNKVSFEQLGGKLTEKGFAGEINFVKTKKFYYSF